jgi:type IV pilus assembly protein PilO
MAKIPQINVDFKEIQDQITAQFSGLDPNDPSQWPVLPRNLLYVAVCLVVIAGLWFTWLQTSDEELVAEKTREEQLRTDYRSKLVQAVNLDALKKQLEQVQQYVNQLERQLPSKAEMDALLSDINQAGLGRSLQFELFRPGQVLVKEYYAELPV